MKIENLEDLVKIYQTPNLYSGQLKNYAWLKEKGLIEKIDSIGTLKLSEKGRFFVDHLMTIHLPIESRQLIIGKSKKAVKEVSI